MIKVWILFVWFTAGMSGGGAGIDHVEFDTKDSCVQAATYIKSVQHADKAFCVAADRYRSVRIEAPSR